MPFDPRVAPALAALRPRLDAFRSAVATSHARAQGLLALGGSVSRVAQELGAFAASRIDIARFVAIDAGQPAHDVAARSVISKAAEVLDGYARATDESFVVDVPPGGSLVDFTSVALGQAGRAFGAATVVELVRASRYNTSEHAAYLDYFGFDRWGRAERAMAPPLVIVVDGADLRVGGLADFLDGGIQVVLVVRGTCAPAPLARLITPGVLVIQSNDASSLGRLASSQWPAVAALVPDTAARFAHHPGSGKGAWQRLSVSFRPESPRRTLGLWSIAQQREELLQLDVLSTPPSLGDASIESLAPGRDGDPVDRLASWLLAASGQAS
jgi:hypothetical protein